MTQDSSRLCVLALVCTALGCTATQTREFTREKIVAPPPLAAAPAKRFAAPAPLVFSVLVDALRARNAKLEDVDEATGNVVAMLRFRSRIEQRQAVRHGSIRKVVTSTKRRYRSFAPLDLFCDECIVRSGELIGHETEMIEDETRPLLYSVELRLEGETRPLDEESPATRLTLRVAVRPRVREPPGLEPQSTGRLEAELFETVERMLADLASLEARIDAAGAVKR